MLTEESFPKLIAEIGLNHFGQVATAEQLIAGAAVAGFDSIKFQYRSKRNSYASLSQIGDELVAEEMRRSHLSPEEIAALANAARRIGLKCGISFFNVEDAHDFGSHALNEFDFFKIPSSELENEALILFFLQLEKPVLISTGMHSTQDAIFELKKYIHFSNWLPMHCVSNYPTSLDNANLGRIKIISEELSRTVGYSSHDSDWRVCLVAMGAGASFLERHVTLDRSLKGLDQTSSSTFDELKEISLFWNSKERILANDDEPNSGSVINLQNLGRSFFAVRSIGAGERVRVEDFEYRPPRIGLGYRDFQLVKGRALVHNLLEGEALSSAHLEPNIEIKNTRDLREMNVALPVRPGDYQSIAGLFNLGAYEFHLSALDVDQLPGDLGDLSSDRWAIHLPDYLDVDTLLDPFGPNPENALESQAIINKILKFASRLSQATGLEIPVVASFTSPHLNEAEYFERFLNSYSKIREEGVLVSLQWMPPFAWYFGGSVRIERNNSLRDALALKQAEVPITLDSSHLLMGSRYFDFSPLEVTRLLRDNIIHIHLSDAHGVDGEGVPFSTLSPNNEFLDYLLTNFSCMKTLEVWQGHLNRYQGFSRALDWVSQRR